MNTYYWSLRTTSNASGTVWQCAQDVQRARFALQAKLTRLCDPEFENTWPYKEIAPAPDSFDVLFIGSFSFNEQDSEFSIDTIVDQLKDDPIVWVAADRGSGFCSALDG